MSFGVIPGGDLWTHKSKLSFTITMARFGSNSFSLISFIFSLLLLFFWLANCLQQLLYHLLIPLGSATTSDNMECLCYKNVACYLLCRTITQQETHRWLISFTAALHREICRLHQSFQHFDTSYKKQASPWAQLSEGRPGWLCSLAAFAHLIQCLVSVMGWLDSLQVSSFTSREI